MAQISITIPDDRLQRVLDGFASAMKYPDLVPGADGMPIPNPETKQQFFRRMLLEYIRTVVRAEERKAAVAALPPPADLGLS